MWQIVEDMKQFVFMLFWEKISAKRRARPDHGIGALVQFGTKNYIDYGLSPEEQRLYAYYENRPGRALVLGCSAGRECVYLAKKGWQVEGIDYIEDLIEIGKVYAAERSLNIKYRVRDVCEIDKDPLLTNNYDLILLSILPLIVGRNKRGRILRTLSEHLAENGRILIYFQGMESYKRINNTLINILLRWLKKDYEKGDYYAFGRIMHVFTEEELKGELKKHGLEVEAIASGNVYRCALVKKMA